MRVLACGSRTFEDAQSVWNVLRGFNLPSEKPFVVIHGAARGADSHAANWAATQPYGRGVKVEAYPADWDKYGKAAGPIRNQQMLDEGKPDLVIAFVDKPLAESRGTAHMVKIARAAGLPVYVVEKLVQQLNGPQADAQIERELA